MMKWVLGVGGIAALIVAWILISPLFIDRTVEEALPTLADIEKMSDEEKAKVRDAVETAARSQPDKEMSEDMMEEGGPEKIIAGEFRDADAIHKGSGDAFVFRLQDGSHVVRFENFRSTNGPDLRVWLSSSPSPQKSADVSEGEWLDLGKLKGNVGNQNYAVPAGTDLSEFQSVVIWCRAFGVLFAAADFVPAG